MHIFVKKHTVEFIAEIVMMGGVALGTARRVQLMQPAERPFDHLQQRQAPATALRGIVARKEIEQSVEITGFDFEFARHPGFREPWIWPQHKMPNQSRRTQAHPDLTAGFIAEAIDCSVGIDDDKMAGADEVLDQPIPH